MTDLGLDRLALIVADSAALDVTHLPPIDQTTHAIAAYVFALEYAEQHTTDLGRTYPSLNEWRAHRAELLAR